MGYHFGLAGRRAASLAWRSCLRPTATPGLRRGRGRTGWPRHRGRPRNAQGGCVVARREIGIPDWPRTHYGVVFFTAVLGSAPLSQDGPWIWREAAEAPPPVAIAASVFSGCAARSVQVGRMTIPGHDASSRHRFRERGNGIPPRSLAIKSGRCNRGVRQPHLQRSRSICRTGLSDNCGERRTCPRHGPRGERRVWQ